MVIYFSGNGNSKAIAVSIAEKLKCKYLALEGKLLITPESNDIECNDKCIIWVFPVYSWGMPPVVANFIQKSKIKNAHKCLHHLVVSCGDDTGLIAQQWRKTISKREWQSGSATSIVMPNTYVLMKGFDTDSKELETKKLDECKAAIQHAVDRIKNDCVDDDMLKGKFAWIKSHIIYPWFIRYAMSAKPFHSTEACFSCGKCARQCPMENIAMVNGHPTWSDKCALCLRCYHRCPVKAIAYGNSTDGKHQYQYPDDES